MNRIFAIVLGILFLPFAFILFLVGYDVLEYYYPYRRKQ
jgi:hypothetical protein